MKINYVINPKYNFLNTCYFLIIILFFSISPKANEYEDFIKCGSEEQSKSKGLMRSEGKDYFVKDGDIIHFRYNV